MSRCLLFVADCSVLTHAILTTEGRTHEKGKTFVRVFTASLVTACGNASEIWLSPSNFFFYVSAIIFTKA